MAVITATSSSRATAAQLVSFPRRCTTPKAAVSFSSFSSAWSSAVFLQRRFRKPARMLQIRAARAESKGVSLGFRAPQFELPEPLTGKVWKLEDFEPYPALLKGLAVVAISSNSTATHPQDGPEFMAEDAKQFKYPFPYLYDESQVTARDFGAVCTPEFFLFRKNGRRPFELVYHGQFDDSRPSNGIPVTGRDLSQAIDNVLSGQPVTPVQKPSIGCSIKWHPELKA